MFVWKISLSALLTILAWNPSLAQVVQSYESPWDNYLQLETLTLSSVSDNKKGIYANPVSEALKAELTTVSWKDFVPSLTVVNSRPQTQTEAKLENQGIDGAITLLILKSDQNLAMEMKLVSAKDAKLIYQVTKSSQDLVDVEGAKRLSRQLLFELLGALPYQGVILSRQEKRVTLNIGSERGLKVGEILNAVLITNAERHPLTEQVTKTTKQPLGRIQITHVESKLSIGQLLDEAYPLVVKVGTKVEWNKPKVYSDPMDLRDQGASSKAQPIDTLNRRLNGALRLGLGLGSIGAGASLDPSVSLSASPVWTSRLGFDFHFLPMWSFRGDFQQSQVNFKENSPNVASLSNYQLQSKYHYFFETQSRSELSVGIVSSNSVLRTDAKNGFELVQFGGFGLIAGGKTEILKSFYNLTAGVNLHYYLSPSSNLGGSSNLSHGQIFAEITLSSHSRWALVFDSETFTTSGGGSSLSGLSLNHQTLAVEYSYLF